MFKYKKILQVLLLFFAASKFSLANSEQENNTNTIPLDEIRIFTEIFSKIKSDYVENIDDKVLLKNAIHGMLQGLDPHSVYLDKEAYKEFLHLSLGTWGQFLRCASFAGFLPCIANASQDLVQSKKSSMSSVLTSRTCSGSVLGASVLLI